MTTLTAPGRVASGTERPNAIFAASGCPPTRPDRCTFALEDGTEICAAEVVEGAVTSLLGDDVPGGRHVHAVTATYTGDDTYAAATAELEWRLIKPTDVARQADVRTPDRADGRTPGR